MNTRTGRGILLKLDGTPWANAELRLTLISRLIENCEIAVEQASAISSDGSGEVSHDFLVGGTYKLRLPDKRKYTFTAPEGTGEFCLWSGIEAPPIDQQPIFAKLADLDSVRLNLEQQIEAIVVGETEWGAITGTLTNQADLALVINNTQAQVDAIDLEIDLPDLRLSFMNALI